MKKFYFTLFELVLIAGCAAVAAALTVAAAKNMAADPKVAVCANNIRILEQKLTAWENANDGHMISRRYCSRLWGRQLLDGGFFNDTGFYGNNLKVYPRHFNCPAETRQRNNGKVNISKPSVNVNQSYDYGLNYYVHQRIDEAGKKLAKRSDLQRPSKVMRMTEGTASWVSYDPDTGTSRHIRGGANVLFGDGHVEFVDVVPFKKTANYTVTFWFNK